MKLGGLGDVFLSTIVLDSLLGYFKSATLDYFVEEAGKAAISDDARVHSIFVLDKKRMNPVAVMRAIRRHRYDMVIDLFGNPRSAILTFFSGATYRVGLDYGWRKHLYSIVGQASRENLHGAEVNLQVLAAMQIPRRATMLSFRLSSQDVAYAEDFWQRRELHGKFVLGVLPAGSWPSKRCEPFKLAEIASAIASRYNAEILVVWGPSDESDALEIERRAKTPVILAPRASLTQNVALLSRCRAIIANDSGPMHIASSFRVPILCIYGPTNPEGPYGGIHGWVRNEGLECLVCNRLHCPIQHQCMTELPIHRVMAAFEEMLRKNGINVPG